MILYLHGFMSGPGSHKARLTGDYLASIGREADYACPKLSPYPADAIALLCELITNQPAPPALIGSSLGSYYALYLAERFDCRAVLVNPAVRPYDDLARFLGPQISPYTGEAFTLEPRHIDELKAIEVPAITHPERYWLLTQTGDEVLDYRQGVAKLAGAKQTIEEGGNHGFQGFDRHLHAIICFANNTESFNLC